MKISDVRLKIVQQGVGTVFDRSLGSKKDSIYRIAPGSSKQIQVVKLPGSNQPAVVLAQASGGNRCCVDLHIYQLDDKSGVFVETAKTTSSEKPGSFDNSGFTVEKLTHGYVFQGVDKNGKLQVLRFTRRHKFRDVTRSYNLPTI